MSENTTETNEPANGVTNGAPNGATGAGHHTEHEEEKPVAASEQKASVPHNNKKKHKHKHRGGKPAPSPTPSAPATTAPVEVAPPIDAVAEAPADAPVDAPTDAPADANAAELAAPTPPETQEPSSEQILATEQPATTEQDQPEQPVTLEPGQPAVPLEAPSFLPWPPSLPQQEEAPPPQAAVAAEALRLRMKIWTDPATSKRYLMPTAFMRDVRNGQPISDVMYAYAMRDDDTKVVTLTAREWNSLPFFYFEEDGPAPRATTRPVDVIR